MNINSNTKKKISEATYLSTDNTWRYRVIMRIAFSQYEKMKFWLYKEEIYNIIKEIDGFSDYIMDNLKQDLDSLESWGNFTTVQDTSRAKTLEEFKNRKFRYQISPNTIELERTLIKIESVKEVSRGSLEISLIERYKDTLEKIKEIKKMDIKDIYSWWDLLNKDFKMLNENYQDYISKFYSPKTEKLLKTTEFLIFKESFIKYLREFIKGLQLNMPIIKNIFQNENDEDIKVLIKKIVEYEKVNISFDAEYDLEEAFDIDFGRYINMKEWFVENNGNISMVDNLLDNTNEIIRKITRYALQIIEMQMAGGNRKEEYKTLINIFNNCKDVEEAHKLSSVVFGVFSSRHIVCEIDRETEKLDSSIYEEKPTEVIVKPSNRYREKTASRVYVKDKSEAKKKRAIEILEKRARERKLLESRIVDNKLIFKDLQGITSEERGVFLRWLSAGLNKKNKNWTRNEFGRYYKVHKNSEENILIKCEDGDFYMPSYELIFKEEG